MPTTAVVLARYIYLDVVRFSRRTVENQSYIVGALNSIVSEALAKAASASEITKKQPILLPTGDGICIALVGNASPDLHVRLALDILRRLHDHNAAAENPERAFEVRVGLNSNHDNVVTDVNNRRNIAGAGINLAQRIMSMADGGQVLLGATDVSALAQRDGYTEAFREYLATVKHGVKIAVYQLTSSHPGLNVDEPSQLVRSTPRDAVLSQLKDVEFLRRLPQEVRQEAELALRRAAYPDSMPPEVVSFLTSINLPKPTAVWRSGYEVFMSVERDVEDVDAFRSEVYFRWLFINPAERAVVVPQMLYTTPPLPIAGKSPGELLDLHGVYTDRSRLSSFAADLVSVKKLWESEADIEERDLVGPIDDCDSSRFSFMIEVPAMAEESEGSPFAYRSTYVHDAGGPWFTEFYSPVRDLSLSLQCPSDVRAELYVFGAKADGRDSRLLQPLFTFPKYRKWVYRGWLTAGSGITLMLR